MKDGGHAYSFTLRGVTYRVHTVCGEGLTRIVIETTTQEQQCK